MQAMLFTPFQVLQKSVILYLTSTEDYIQRLVLEARVGKQGLDPATRRYHYHLTASVQNQSLAASGPFKLFHYLSGLSLREMSSETVSLDFDSSLRRTETENSTEVRVDFSSNHELEKIEFILLIIRESPADYQIDIEEIDYEQSTSVTNLLTENSFLGKWESSPSSRLLRQRQGCPLVCC